MKPICYDTAAVGKCLKTKAIGSCRSVEITDLYKYKEGGLSSLNHLIGPFLHEQCFHGTESRWPELLCDMYYVAANLVKNHQNETRLLTNMGKYSWPTLMKTVQKCDLI